MIGTGGWAYFGIPGLHPLVAYSKAFGFVEANSTFYQIPSLKQVEKWRRIVPQDFQFAVRAHKMMTHKHRLQPTQEVLEVLRKLERICRILRAEVIHVQTPSSLKIEELSNENIRDIMSLLNFGKTRIAFEMKGSSASQLPSELVEIMKEYGIVHCVDLSKGELPAYDSDVLYSRLFGKGYHNVYQPTDEELREIDGKTSRRNSKKVMLSFHFVKMYKDAARLKMYKQTGKFPMITKSTGLASLEHILREDIEFPINKTKLIQRQGWKIFDLTSEKRVHAWEYLQELPEKTYKSFDDVKQMLRKSLK